MLPAFRQWKTTPRTLPYPMNDLATDLPLCVDLDGTLIKSDLLLESALGLLAQRPLAALQMPLWLLRGKANLKQQIAERVQLDVSLLPYRTDLLEYITREHQRGRTVVLATASHRTVAEQVAAHLGVFDRVMATENGMNLSGAGKGRRLVEEFGERGFVYAGNERKDLQVWRSAGQAILVGVAPSVQREAQMLLPIAGTYQSDHGTAKQYLRALRLHQWLKNFLIFLPLVAAHRLTDVTLAVNCVIAFLAFGFCASSVYLLNDLVDLEADRKHARKRLRPFASGQASVLTGLLLIPFLLLLSFVLALALPPLFGAVLAGYFATTVLYSLWAKRRAIFDVMFLAGLYTVRILAGAAAIAIAPSFWILAFSMFIFLSLALVKRYGELIGLNGTGAHRASGRGYLTADLPVLQSMGAASGYMAVLVLALYINSPDISKLYQHPKLMWLSCPLLLFWISRVWLKAQRGEMHDDPIVFAVTDRVSQLIAVFSFLVIVAAT